MIIDILFIVIFILACFKGFKNGLILGIFSLLGFLIGLAAAVKLSASLSAYLQNNGMSTKWLPFVSFILVFIGACLLIKIGATLIKSALKLVMLGWLDRIGGIILYLFLYLLIFSVLTVFAARVGFFNQQLLSASTIYPYINSWGQMVIDNFSKVLPVFKDMFLQLEDFFASGVKK